MARSRARKKARLQVWDFFIAPASPDKKAAGQLRDLLQAKKSIRVFLDSEGIAAGDCPS